jgi:hypothetical protein
VRLHHRLVSRVTRPKAEIALVEHGVPLRLQPLQDLLDHAIDHGWNGEVARSTGCLNVLAADGSAPEQLSSISGRRALRMPGNCLMVMPSTPGAPLLRTTARSAVSI